VLPGVSEKLVYQKSTGLCQKWEGEGFSQRARDSSLLEAGKGLLNGQKGVRNGAVSLGRSFLPSIVASQYFV
jgi:hypothetical protein